MDETALRDIQGAIADYEKAVELDPEDAITLNNLGLLEEQIGRMQSAKERFAAADAMDRILDESSIPKRIRAGARARSIASPTFSAGEQPMGRSDTRAVHAGRAKRIP